MFFKKVSFIFCCFFSLAILTASSASIANEQLGESESSTQDFKPGASHTSPNASRYVEFHISGYRVMVADTIADKAYTLEMLRLLRASFKKADRYFLKEFTAKIRQSPIWLEQQDGRGVAAYHPSVEWLRAHGVNEEFAHCIQCADTRSGVAYLKNNQPYMYLHEMSHLVHHLVLGYENRPIIEAYENAMRNRLYENVLYYSHGKFRRVGKAYCCNNYKEYFAELTEAYFGVNDFYPFTRSQLEEHDPVGYAMMEKIWKQKSRYDKSGQKRFLEEKYDRREP